MHDGHTGIVCAARLPAQHPGFDFSQASFNGQVPNPRTFMRDLDDAAAPPPPLPDGEPAA